ncbi:phosphotransferase [Salinicola sp. LHM]|uniref:phosphotransferase n=1 Tax=Salinicola sp. LHM TaxID=3065298 RepID=UPI002ACE6E50|nr:phosphotransferase [Salinicola sp. LHM]WQH31691.1 phosphotransferase [Salinicola sp. LHM]
MPGFVDEVSQGVVRGWYVADDGRQSRACQSVVISVNGEERFCALCQDARPDVVEAGITREGGVGFLAPLALQIGDLVRVRALESGQLLGGGLAVVMPPGAEDGFLTARASAELPAFQSLLQPLRPHLTINAFRPLFGHRGKLSALCIDTPAGRRVVHAQRPVRNALWLERLHRRVLEPNGIAAPSLEAVLIHGETASLVVEHIEGQTLDGFTGDNEQAFRDTLAAALRLPSVRWVTGMGGDRRGRKAFGKLVSGVCLAALKRQHWRELRLLLGMVRAVYRLPRVFSHGDLHPQNVLIESRTGRPVFIDWDHADRLPVGFDLSRLLMNVPPALAERWIDESPEAGMGRGTQASQACRLGWLILTYFAHAQRSPDFHATEEAAYLRQRFIELPERSNHKPEMMSQSR